jgi:hypothetical protein
MMQSRGGKGGFTFDVCPVLPRDQIRLVSRCDGDIAGSVLDIAFDDIAVSTRNANKVEDFVNRHVPCGILCHPT